MLARQELGHFGLVMISLQSSASRLQAYARTLAGEQVGGQNSHILGLPSCKKPPRRRAITWSMRSRVARNTMSQRILVEATLGRSTLQIIRTSRLLVLAPSNDVLATGKLANLRHRDFCRNPAVCIRRLSTWIRVETHFLLPTLT